MRYDFIMLAPDIEGVEVQADLEANQVVALNLAGPLGKTPTGVRVIGTGPSPCTAIITGPGRDGLTDVMATATGFYTLWVY